MYEAFIFSGSFVDLNFLSIFIDGNCVYKLEEKKLICNYDLPIQDTTDSVKINISNNSAKEVGSLSLKIDYSYDSYINPYDENNK